MNGPNCLQRFPADCTGRLNELKVVENINTLLGILIVNILINLSEST